MSSVIPSRQPAGDLDVHRLQEELRSALSRADTNDLKEWGIRSARRFASVLAKRAVNLAALVSQLTTGAADEVLEALLALSERRIKEHLSDRAEAANAALQSLRNAVEGTFRTLQDNLGKRPAESAAQLFSAVVGFYAGSGGDGDGGIPDLDFLAGVGAHRSIFTHSIVAGAFVETAVLSVVDLTTVIHGKLPADHDPFWDKLLKYQDLSSRSLVTGSSLGIATHLGIDTTIDGFTPYKDLPISLPLELHEALMGLNAAAEGAYGLNQLFGLHLFREDSTRRQVKSTPKLDGPTSISNLPRLPKPSRIDETHLRELPARDRFVKAEKLARQAAEDLRLETGDLDRSVEAGKQKMLHAAQPLRLGVIGEFRAGKSTLINALVGEDVAFVDILEATPVECVFRYGDDCHATIVHKDGRREIAGFAAVNETLSDRRHDAAWSGSVDHVEYLVPSTRLRQFDLWDAPGMGGGAANQAIADTFLERLGAAVWVFDATLLGKATIAAPIETLRRAGKPVVAAINRIDEFHDEIEQACALLERIYPGTFDDVVALSAAEACETVFAGMRSEPLERLWEAVCRSAGVSETEGQDARLERAAAIACEDLGNCVTRMRREAEDRLGLVEHVRENLLLAKRNLLDKLQSILDEETATGFRQVELELASQVSQVETRPGVAGKITAFFNDPRTQRGIAQEILSRSIARTRNIWSQFSDEAIDLSRAAVPFAMVSVSQPDQLAKQVAMEDAVFAGGVSFSIAAVVAATTAVTWPAILLAIPIGSLAWWKRTKEAERAQLAAAEQFANGLAELRGRFVSEVMPKLAEEIGRTLDAAIENLVRSQCEALLSDPNDARARVAVADLRTLQSVLAGERATNPGRDISSKDLLTHLQDPGPRLDIYTPTLDFSLAPLLQCLPPGTDVRLVTRCGESEWRDVTENVERAFGNWQGKRNVVGVCLADGGPLPSDQTLVLTTDLAIVTDASLATVGRPSARFSHYPNGRLAGQRRFAELWGGRSSEHGALHRRSIY